ncbi:MAG: GtrA family protein [archaeon]
MLEKIRQSHLFLKYKKYLRFICFCFVGGAATLIHILAFNFFRFWMNFGFIESLILAVLSSIVFNFTMNRNITFSARGYPIKKQILRYIIVYTISIGTEITVAILMKNLLGEGFIKENIALFTSYAVSIPLSFFGSLFWAFKKN